MDDAPRNPRVDEQQAFILSQAQSGIKWSALGTLGPRLITPFTSVALAVLLEPAAFGLVAIANAIINLAQVVVLGGMRDVIVQRPEEEISEVKDFVFTFALLVGLLAYSVIFVAAGPLERLYDMPQLAAVMRVSGLTIVVLSLTVVPEGTLQREMRFSRLFILNGLPQILAALLSVVWALLGGGVWALVIGPIISGTTIFIVGWFLVDYRPRPPRNLGKHLNVLIFSSWILLSNLLRWGYNQLDNVIAGLFFSATLTGYYMLAFNLTALLPSLLTSIFMQVAYPAFCAIQEDAQRVGHSLIRLQRLVSAIVFPVCFGLSAVARPFVTVIYGEKWVPMGDIMMILAILPALTHFWSLNGEAYRAINQPRLWTLINLVGALAVIPAVVVGGFAGLLTFAVARGVASSVIIGVNLWATQRELQVSILEQVQSLMPTMVASLVMFFVVVAVQRMPPLAPPTLFGLLGLILLGALTYLLALRLVAPALFAQLWQAGLQTIRT